MCPYVSVSVGVCVCMSAKSVYTCVKHPKKQRASEGGGGLSVFACVCVCRRRECVYVSRHCVTPANESLRSPAVQG